MSAPGVEGGLSAGRVGRTRSSAVLDPVRSRRRPWLMAVGVLVSALGVLIVVWLVGTAGQRKQALVVARDVPYGQVIAAADLSVAGLAADAGVHALPASSSGSVVGRVAAVNLSAGMLLTAEMTDPVGEPGPGRVLVPLALAVDRIPVSGLRAGDRVRAVDAQDPRQSVAAVVVAVGEPDVDAVSVIDVTTLAADGPRLAASSANRQVVVILEPREP